MPCPIIKLASQLIKCRSLSPKDAGCQLIISNRLQALGFIVELMQFEDTINTWAWHGQGHTLVFAGHTDVVDIGNEQNWNHPPFKPTLLNGQLYGRGAADMKGPLAAMVIAAERFVTQHPNHKGRLAFMITSDEEGEARNGTNKVVEVLTKRQEQLDYCLIGEPTSKHQIGDIIKNGRRGSLTADLTVYGVQGHVAYPCLAVNPMHIAINMLKELVETRWDNGNDFFPPTTMQLINIRFGNINSSNVIPDTLHVRFNFRFSTELSDVIIRQRVETIIQKHKLTYCINWTLYGNPFITTCGKLLKTVMHVVECYQGLTPHLETTGGTSDGRFIASMGTQIVELGPINATIHKINECVSIKDLQLLSVIYQRVIEELIL